MLLARSPRLAVDLGRLLNGEELAGVVVDDRAPVPRYSASAGSGGRWLVDAADRGALYGTGSIASTTSEPLAQRVAELLNEHDPGPRRVRGRGFGRLPE